MKIVYALIKIVILLAFVLLAVSNTHSTAFHYLPGQEISLPLIVLLLVCCVVGAIFGVRARGGRLLTLRNEVNRLRREIRKNGRSVELEAAPPATTAAASEHQKG